MNLNDSSGFINCQIKSPVYITIRPSQFHSQTHEKASKNLVESITVLYQQSAKTVSLKKSFQVRFLKNYHIILTSGWQMNKFFNLASSIHTELAGLTRLLNDMFFISVVLRNCSWITKRSLSLGGCLIRDCDCIFRRLSLFSRLTKPQSHIVNFYLSLSDYDFKNKPKSTSISLNVNYKVWIYLFSPSPFWKRAFSSSVSATRRLTIADPLFMGFLDTMTKRALVNVCHPFSSGCCCSTSIVASIDDFPTHVKWPRRRISALCCNQINSIQLL